MSNQYCPLRKTDILLILNICYDCLRKRVYAIRVRYISITSVFIYLFLQSCDNLYYILKHFVDIYKFFIHVLSIKVKSILQARVTKTRQLVVRKNVSSLIFYGQTGQKQSSRGVLKNRCYENMQQIYRGHSCRSVISIKLLCNFIEITFWYGCSPINFAAYFQNTFSSERLWVAASAWSYKVVLENHKDVLGSRKFQKDL